MRLFGRRKGQNMPRPRVWVWKYDPSPYGHITTRFFFKESIDLNVQFGEKGRQLADRFKKELPKVSDVRLHFSYIALDWHDSDSDSAHADYIVAGGVRVLKEYFAWPDEVTGEVASLTELRELQERENMPYHSWTIGLG